jgi:sugar lactone lactonase YvrE
MMIRRKTGICMAPLLALLGACGGEGGDAAAEVRIDTLADGSVHVLNHAERGETWQVREVWRIGALDSDGPDQFGRIGALEADASGRVYVLDLQAHEVRVFDAGGRHLRSFGREGGGPGELKQPSGLSLAPNGNLWVANPGNTRYEVFDTTGAFVTSRRQLTQMMSFPWGGLVDRSGRVYDSGFGLVLRAEGEAEPDTIRLPEYAAPRFVHTTGTSSMSYSIPYSPQLHWALDPDGRLWTGVSDAYRITLRDDAGNPVRTVEKPYTPLPVTASEREGVRERLRGFTDQGGTVDLSRVPRHKAAFTRLAFDDRGFLWVRPSLPADAEDVVFDVFDPDGLIVGSVRLPVTPTALGMALEVRGNRLYAAVESEDGVPQVVAFELMRR